MRSTSNSSTTRTKYRAIISGSTFDPFPHLLLSCTDCDPSRRGDVGNYDHGGFHTTRNRDTTYHTYGVNWTPSQIQWSVDGSVVRTFKKSDAKDNRYPQTPSRVQFSVWPAGVDGASKGVRFLSSSPSAAVALHFPSFPPLLTFFHPPLSSVLPPPQTIDWAGGMIDWSQSEYTSKGYFASNIRWVSIDCYSGSDLDLPFVASNQSTNSSSKSSRMGRRDETAPLLWERADSTVNSYVWGGASPFLYLSLNLY